MMKFRLPLLSLLIVVTSFVSACSGCSSSVEVDEDPAVRVAELASFIPGDTDAALVVPEIRQMPDTLDYILARYRHVDPGAQDLATRFSQELGVQLTSLEMLELAGFHPDGSLIFSLVDGRFVLTAHVADKNAFVRYFIGNVRREHGTQTRISDEELGGREYTISGDTRQDDMAWYFNEDDSIVVLVMAPYDFLEDFITSNSDDVATTLAEMDSDATLANSDHFATFREQFGDDYPISLYLSRPQLGDGDSDVASDVIAMGFRAEPRRVNVDLFVDGSDITPGALGDDEVLATILANLGLADAQRTALGDSLDQQVDDDSLQWDFTALHDRVRDISALEERVSLVRAIEDISIATDADGPGTLFGLTIDFTDPVGSN